MQKGYLSRVQPLTVFRRSDTLLLLEHPAEVLGIFEAEAVGHLRDGFPCRQPVLGKLDDELADVVARRVTGGFLDDIAEVVGGHTQFVGAILHGGQAVAHGRHFGIVDDADQRMLLFASNVAAVVVDAALCIQRSGCSR